MIPKENRGAYFQPLAEAIERGEYVPCRFCPTSLSLDQLDWQYEMCDEHWEGFCRRRWPERYPPHAKPGESLLLQMLRDAAKSFSTDSPRNPH